MDLIERYISVDSNICHGKPCFKGHRIPEHIKAALQYAARVLEFREFDPIALKRREALW